MEKKKSNRNKIITIIIFVIGILILIYPFISDRWNTWRQNKLIVDMNNQVGKISAIEKKELLRDARTFNKSLVGSVVPDVFAIRDGVEDKNYEKLLNVYGKGVMGSVEIPKIKVDLPIYHYTTEKVLIKGAGHIFGSSLPVGGKSTHCLISAHRGLPSAKMFTDLDLMKKGDEFYINILDEKLAYEIDKIEVVEPDDTKSLSIKKEKDYVTLVTCTPYGINTKRLLVRGHRVPYNKKIYKKEGNKHASKWTRVVTKIICVLLGLMIAYLIQSLIDGNKKKKSRELNE